MSGLSNAGEPIRLATAFIALFPQRVMLNSKELAAVVQLEASPIPKSQLLAWAHEMQRAQPQQHMSALLRQLVQRAQKWRAARVGDRYASAAQVNIDQLRVAFQELMSEVKRAEAEMHDPALRQVLMWLNQRLSTIMERALLDERHKNHLKVEDLSPAMRSLSEETQERLFISAPQELIERSQRQTHVLLERESHRSRPQDFVIAQRAVWWTLIRDELGLPRLRLPLFDGW